MNSPSFSRSGRFFVLGISILGAIALLFTFITTATAASLPPLQFQFLGSNTPPSLGNLTITTPIWENHTATLTGEIVDPDLDDTFTLHIDWGDGMTQSLSLPAGTTVFTATQLYLDDNPSGTPQDDYTVQLTLSDSAGNTDTDSVVLTVKNFAPQWTFGFPTSRHFDEGEPASANVIFNDMSPNDTFTFTIGWGDGNSTTYTYPAGSAVHTVTHIYADDNPSGTLFDEYFLTHTWTDDDLGGYGPFPYPHGVYVQNVAPTLSNLVATSINEDGLTTLTGNISDPGILDTFTLAVDWGDNEVVTYTYPAGTTAFTETHPYLTGLESPATQTYFLTLTDDDGGQDTASLSLNIAPEITNLTITTPIWENYTATLTGEIVDPDLDDTFTLDIDWGDGMTQTLSLPAGTTVFTATQLYLDDNPSGTPQDDYTVQLTLSDSAGNTDTDSVVLTVKNFAPNIIFIFPSAPVFDEGELALAKIKFNDMSPLDTFTYTIGWGDNTFMTYTFPASTDFHTITHIYADDNPSGTLFDEYFHTHTWTDDDLGGHAPYTYPFGVNVQNVAPTLSNLVATSVNEDGLTTLTGNISDPGILDTFTLAVDWGDNTVTTYTYPAGTTAFTETHTYTDGAGTLQPTAYTLFLTLTDDDTGQGTATVQVNNAPTITSLSATGPINENGTTTLIGTFNDPDPQDTFTVLVNWGDGNVLTATYPAGATDFMHTHTYLDDPAGNVPDAYTITVTLTDDDGGTDTDTTAITVHNLAPTVDAGPDQTADDGTLLTFTGVFTDPGTLDTHTILWDFGDGITVTGTLAPTYLYAGPGLYIVTLTITDDDGDVTQDTLQVTVQAIENPEFRVYLPLITH